jgi:hypothetical protein
VCCSLVAVAEHNPAIALYFYAFLIICSFFAINLFVGVVIDKFSRMKEEMDGSAFQTAEQKQWYGVDTPVTSRASCRAVILSSLLRMLRCRVAFRWLLLLLVLPLALVASVAVFCVVVVAAVVCEAPRPLYAYLGL